MEKSTKKWIVIGTIVIGVLAGAWVIIKKLKSNKTDKEIADAVEATESGLVFPIKKGYGYDNEVENSAVMLIQRWINNNSYWDMEILAEDGKFGQSTEFNLGYLTNVTEVDKEFFDEMKADLQIV